MKEHGLIFSDAMVDGIFNAPEWSVIQIPIELPEFGPSDTKGYDWCFRDKRMRWNDYTTQDLIASKHNPFGTPGSKIWVKEAWATVHLSYSFEGYFLDVEDLRGKKPSSWHDKVFYRSTGPDETAEERGFRWRPARQMPQWASRLMLEIEDVSICRLQDITDAQLADMGLVEDFVVSARSFPIWQDIEMGADLSTISNIPLYYYQQLWEEAYPQSGWESNPWTWMATYKKQEIRHWATI